MTDTIYILNIWVQPGGANFNNYYALRSREGLLRVMSSQLKNPYLAVWYGLNMELHIAEGVEGVYESIKKYDMMKYFILHVGKFSPIRFNQSDTLPIGYRKSKILDPDYVDMQRAGEINFDSNDVNEVARYINYNTMELFRKVRREGNHESDEEPIQPDVTIEFDSFDDIPEVNRYGPDEVEFEDMKLRCNAY